MIFNTGCILLKKCASSNLVMKQVTPSDSYYLSQIQMYLALKCV
jgi:hypothetical protein